MTDKRIGTRTQSYPEVDIAGREYSRPATTINLGDKKFCVDNNSVSQDDRERIIAELKAIVNPPKTTKKVAKTDE